MSSRVVRRRASAAIHLYYVELWREIETLLGRWHVPFKLFLTLTSSHGALEQRVRAKYSDCEIRRQRQRRASVFGIARGRPVRLF
jgi:lipopolysaccharide biosynthesis protein